jgi:hypothetical protein
MRVLQLSFIVAVAACKNGGDSNVADTFDWTGGDDVVDADGDGVPAADGDCDDADAAVYPGAVDACNGADDNCNSAIDEGQPDADADGTCDGLDVEECDGVDNNGDGFVDEGFPDADIDGVADCAAGERCDGVDNDGDGDVDEGYDADADGVTSCGGDCDDASAAVKPGVGDTSGNRVDDDCDGYVDENDWSAGDLVITEIMADPSVPDPQGEWFEVRNDSGAAVVLNGLMITSGDASHRIASATDLELAAGALFVIGSDGDRFVNGNVAIGYVDSGISLGNVADDLALSVVDDADQTVVIDAVAWSSEAGFPPTAGAAMALDPDASTAAGNDAGSAWCSAAEGWDLTGDLGSPNVENPLCETIDHDGDGQDIAHGDCDDRDPTVYAGAPELDASVDSDCDGVAELGPVAQAAFGAGAAETCTDLILDATGSADADGPTPLTYEWTVAQAPVGSTATFADPSAQIATFAPDLAGHYVFTLVVRDGGGAGSVPVQLATDVTDRPGNSDPVADAGASQVVDAVSECQVSGSDLICDACPDVTIPLDGRASSDPDGDGLTYHWELTSGWGVLDDADTATPSLTLGGLAPAQGTTESRTVFLSLVVTDCVGATSVADVTAVAYSCTASP